MRTRNGYRLQPTRFAKADGRRLIRSERKARTTPPERRELESSLQISLEDDPAKATGKDEARGSVRSCQLDWSRWRDDNDKVHHTENLGIAFQDLDFQLWRFSSLPHGAWNRAR